MTHQDLKSLLVYRMTHVDNVPFIVANGLWSKLSGVQDPDFKAIGNPAIIDRRTNKPVGVIPPGGVLGEYIPFYFSGHSPMLLNIATGYGVDKVPQKDIVFLVCNAIEIIEAGIPYCFTDGNAAHSITAFYNKPLSLVELDWETIGSTVWKNTDVDYDRVRKKMSEFLVKKHLPVSFIKAIVVRNAEVAKKLMASLTGVLPTCSVKIDTNNKLYYCGYD